MSKKITLLITTILTSLSICTLNAQLENTNSFIITLEKDTIHGKLISTAHNDCLSDFEFKKHNNEHKIYKLKDIIEYNDYKRVFRRKRINLNGKQSDYFLQCAFEGQTSLYILTQPNETKYFIVDEDNKIIELSEEKRSVMKNGKTQFYAPKYKYQLKIIFSKEENIYPKIDEMMGLNLKSLLKLSKYYHNKIDKLSTYKDYMIELKPQKKIYDDTPLEEVNKNKLQNGFIINNQNDTIHGKLKFISKQKASQTCYFIESGSKIMKQYYPSDIKAYRYTEGKFYVSKRDPENKNKEISFYEYLIDGTTDAFYKRTHSGDNYYVENKDGSLIKLTEEVRMVNKNMINYSKPVLYKGKLKYALAESKKVQKDIEKVKLNHKSIIKLLTDYHNDVCDSANCIIFEKEKKQTKYKLNIYSGAALAKYNFGSKLCSDYTFSPTLGFGLTIRNFMYDTENLYIQIHLQLQRYSNVTLTSHQKNSSSELIIHNDKRYYLNANYDEINIIDLYNRVNSYDVNLKATSMKIPLSFGYDFALNNKYSSFIEFGASIMFVISQNDEFRYEFFYEEYGKSIPSPLFGFNLGTGVRVKLRNYDIVSLSANYSFDENFNNIDKFHRLKIHSYLLKIGYEF